jgi:cytochrome c553
LKSPSIAAMPSWYVGAQLVGFREGRRGANPQDAPGVLMAAIAKMLKPEQMKSLSAHVETMPLVIPKMAEKRADVDMNNGMLLWQERCMECHRYNGSGELAFGSPPLIGLQDWYLLAQLEKYKNGHRGTMKGDENGAKMVRSVQFLDDAQAMKDVVAYIMTLNTDPVMRGVSDPFESKPVTSAK